MLIVPQVMVQLGHDSHKTVNIWEVDEQEEVAKKRKRKKANPEEPVNINKA